MSVKRYFIEPGDWESATGESLETGSDGVVVIRSEDFQYLIDALEAIKLHQEQIGGGLAAVSVTHRIASLALQEVEA